MPGRARDPHRQARGRPRDRAAVHRRAGQLRADAEPPRLLARAAPPELPDARARRRAARCTASARSATSSPAATSTSRIRRSRTSTASSRPSSCCESSTTGSIFVNLVETDMLWGHRNDPVNFHRCLQDFDRRLPDLLEALRARRPADPHVRPRLRPDDAVDRPLARARAAARVRRRAATRRGGSTRGEFADVGATVNAWLGGKAPAPRHPGPADRRAVKLDDPQLVRRRVRQTRSGLAVRRDRVACADREGPRPRSTLAFDGGRRGRARARARGRLRAGRVRRASRDESSAPRSSRSTSSPRMVELTAAAGSTPASATSRSCRSPTATFDCVVADWMLYHVPDLDRALAELARVLAAARGRLVA